MCIRDSQQTNLNFFTVIWHQHLLCICSLYVHYSYAVFHYQLCSGWDLLFQLMHVGVLAYNVAVLSTVVFISQFESFFSEKNQVWCGLFFTQAGVVFLLEDIVLTLFTQVFWHFLVKVLMFVYHWSGRQQEPICVACSACIWRVITIVYCLLFTACLAYAWFTRANRI